MLENYLDVIDVDLGCCYFLIEGYCYFVEKVVVVFDELCVVLVIEVGGLEIIFDE